MNIKIMQEMFSLILQKNIFYNLFLLSKYNQKKINQNC